jgi:DNA repair exonuclease SbcCD ATPase subunit
MKAIYFDRLEVQDFKEFRGAHSLDLLALGPGVHFVSGWNFVEPRLGSNGAGKSSLWDALCWCLYGKTVAGLRGVDVRSWGSKHQAEVRLTIRAGDKKTIVQRSTKTNGLWMDGKLVEQAEIDRLVGLSYEIFLHTILLGQGEPLFFDLKPTEKMTRLSQTIDLERWEERSSAARKLVQTYDAERAKIEGQKEELGRTLAQAEQAASDIEAKAQAWDREQEGAGKARAASLKEVRKALEFAANQMGNYDLALDSAETEAKATRRRKLGLEREYQKALGSAGLASAQLSTLLDEREQLANKKTHCPTCGQKLGTSARVIQHVKARMGKLDKEIGAAQDANDAFVNAADKLQRQIDAAAKELRGFEDAADDARDNYTRAQSRKAEIEASIKQLEKERSQTEKAINPYADLVKKNKAELRKLDKMCEEIEALLVHVDAKRERTRHWIQGFKNVRLYLLQEVLEELSAVTQTLLPQIGLEDWIIEYAMERETQSGKVLPGLNVNITKPDADKPSKWESWSGGEGQRLRLVGAVALSQVLLRRAGIECSLLVLDEPTKHLSAEGVLDMIEFLADYGRDYQIFYIDHSARDTKRFASGIRVERTAKGSRIISEHRHEKADA